MNGDGDSISGEDPVPETDDEDHLFGGDADDVMWGGRGHDHVWGGHGNDHLDVRPRTASEVTAPDTPEWFTYGEPDNFQGLDIVHGGWDQDALQANFAEPGPPLADRLIDWEGGYNVFYVCPGAYGEGTITHIGSPFLRQFLQDLAESDGALLPATPGTCGFREVGYVFPKDRQHNSHPPHPDHPGYFVCDDGEVEVLETCIEIAGCLFCSNAGAGAFGDADAVEVPDHTCEGDLDADGSVALPDLGILLANYGKPGAWDYEDGDLDEDGDIDTDDLAEFMLYYGTVCEQ